MTLTSSFWILGYVGLIVLIPENNAFLLYDLVYRKFLSNIDLIFDKGFAELYGVVMIKYDLVYV